MDVYILKKKKNQYAVAFYCVYCVLLWFRYENENNYRIDEPQIDVKQKRDGRDSEVARVQGQLNDIGCTLVV